MHVNTCAFRGPQENVEKRRVRVVGSKREVALLYRIVRESYFDKGNLTRDLQEVRK